MLRASIAERVALDRLATALGTPDGNARSGIAEALPFPLLPPLHGGNFGPAHATGAYTADVTQLDLLGGPPRERAPAHDPPMGAYARQATEVGSRGAAIGAAAVSTLGSALRGALASTPTAPTASLF